MESTKNIELWNDCFDSMAENEYESKSLGELEDIYKDWLQERALKCKETEAKATAYDNLVSKTIMSDAELDAPLAQKILREMCEKAEAYDRLMSGGLTMKELANILKHPVAIENDDNQNTLYYFNSTPHIGQFSDGTQFWSCKRKRRLPRQLVNFYGDWKDSLTLPDGWEEK